MTPPRLVHIWDEFMPGQFIEPHRVLHSSSEWDSRVVAGKGINTETFDLPRVSYFTKRSMDRKFKPTLWSRGVDRVQRPIFWYRYQRYCSSVLSKIEPQLIHAHFGFTAARMLPVLKRSSIPALVTFYGVDASAALKMPKWLAAYREMFQRFDRLIVLCEAVKDRMVEAGCPPEKIRVWNLPAGIESYPYRERVRSGSPRFLIAARFTEKKGYRYLLKAFRAFLDSGRKGTLTIIGYGNQRPAIEEQIQSLGLGDSTKLVDSEAKRNFIEVYNELLSHSDIFVLPSTVAKDGDDEGGPALTMVCAQSSGLPVICTPFPGAEITMRDGETGLYCQQDDVDSLLDRMIRLSEKPEVWREWGKAGSDLAVKQFGLDNQMEQLTRIYQELLPNA